MIRIYLVGLLAFVFSHSVWAASSDPSYTQAKKLLERISSTKVPSDHPLIAPMVEKIKSGDLAGAAEIATTHSNFLNLTIKLMALKMSTREETFRLDFNDFAASFVGVTRDQTDARQLLTGNFYYMADATKIPTGVTVRSGMVPDILQSNNHYRDLENPAVDISQVLVRVEGQKIMDSMNLPVDNPDPAGVLTSRAFMGAHAIDGTNRRPIEFSFREFMCVPIEDWSDTGASDLRIGRDIERFPGGDHMKFQTTCKGCHTQMDSLRGAFGKWDFQNGRIVNSAIVNRPGGFSSNGVANKMNKNNTVHPSGFVMVDDSFINNSRLPANEALFGWRGPDKGRGVKELGSMIANSKRFSQCMVKRAYDVVCRTELQAKHNLSFLTEQATKFEQSGYNIKALFKEVAVSQQCLGQ